MTKPRRTYRPPFSVRRVLFPAALVVFTFRGVSWGEDNLPVSAEFIHALDAAHNPVTLVETLGEIEALGCRSPGTDGSRLAAEWIEGRLRRAGFEVLGVQRYVLALPVDSGSVLVHQGEEGETFTVPIHSLRPNLVAANHLPREGLTAPLVDGGAGRLTDLDGKQGAQPDGPGTVVLMDYRSATRWENAAAVGASAVVFLPDPSATFDENLAKFSDAPIQFPRFYIDGEKAAETLRSLARRGSRVTLKGGMTWRNVECGNVIGFLPATVDSAETLLLNVNFDAAGVVPSAAKGGQSACNLAAAILALESVADPSRPSRREQNLLVLFDGARGECNAGARAFAGIVRDLHATALESTTAPAPLMAKMAGVRPWMKERGTELELLIGRLEAVHRWIEGGDGRSFDYTDPMPAPPSPRLPGGSAREWLDGILKERVKGQHIDSVVAAQEIERLRGVDPFAPDAGLPDPVRLARERREYFRILADAGSPEELLAALDANRPRPGVLKPGDATRRSLSSEFLETLEAARSEFDIFREDMAIRNRLEGLLVLRQFAVDLSPGSTILTLTRSQWIGGEADWYPPSAMEWENSLGPLISRGFEGIVDAANRELDGGDRRFDFVDSVTVDASRQRQASPPREFYDPGVDLAMAGAAPFCFVTANDPRPHRLGPGDRVSRDDVSIDNLRTQSMTLALLLRGILADPDLVPLPENGIARSVEVTGKVVMKDARAGPFPTLPVPGSIVVLPARRVVQGSVFQYRVALADRDGGFIFENVPSGETMNLYFNGRTDLAAFKLSSGDGTVRFAPDSAIASRGGYATSIDLFGGDVFRRLVVFRGASVHLFGAVDPMLMFPLESLSLISGDGAGIENWWAPEGRRDEAGQDRFSGTVAAVPRNSRMKFILGLDAYSNRMFLLGDQNKDPAGTGYPVGESLNLIHTVPEAARCLWKLNENRLTELESRGVHSLVARRLHNEAAAHIEEMEVALERNLYSRANHFARGAWGRDLRIYPEITGLARDSVIAVVILLAFLAPWAYFMERIVLRGGSINRRVAGVLGIYAAALVLVFVLHPAFRITVAPVIIVLAYALATMALLALGVILQKYGGVMKRWRQSIGGVHSSDVSRAGAFAVAFNLGLTNMAKRPLRTGLVMLTVALLAFSAMTFTSVEAYLDARMIPISTAGSVLYDGLLFRLYGWAGIPPSMAETFEQDLGPGVSVVRRMWLQRSEEAWYIGLGWNKFVFTRDDTGQTHVAECLQGFMTDETEFSGIDKCVTGSWFSGEDDEIIIPSAAAESLGISADDVVNVPRGKQVRIRYGGHLLRVVGILDTVEADRLVDISGTPLSHVDFYASGILPHRNLDRPVGDETKVRFMGFDRAMILPYSLLESLGGNIKNVAVRFPEGTDARTMTDDLMSRFAVNIYAAVGGKPYLVKTVRAQSLRGAWKLIMPVLLVVLIMINTMLGTVDERIEEIRMLGAVGLAPRHVSFLYLAESCVYGVSGVVFGSFLGLAVGWLTQGMDVGVNVNYASVSTMVMGGLVLMVVVAATLIPASRAALLATPSGAGEWTLTDSRGDRVELRLPFTMTKGNGVGVFSFLFEYLDRHWESTSPDFRCDELRGSVEPRKSGSTVLSIRGRLWLAPYDMRVSQDVALALVPKEATGLLEVHYSAARTSGELSAWKRRNYAFIDLLRKQFLIYRTLDEDRKTHYMSRARDVFGGGNGGLDREPEGTAET